MPTSDERHHIALQPVSTAACCGNSGRRVGWHPCHRCRAERGPVRGRLHELKESHERRSARPSSRWLSRTTQLLACLRPCRATRRHASPLDVFTPAEAVTAGEKGSRALAYPTSRACVASPRLHARRERVQQGRRSTACPGPGAHVGRLGSRHCAGCACQIRSRAFASLVAPRGVPEPKCARPQIARGARRG